MLEKSFGLFYFLKQAKTKKKELRYIYLRITVDGISKEISTKRMWDPARWDAGAGKAKGYKEDVVGLNSYLDAYTMSVYAAKSKLLLDNKFITADALKAVLTGSDEVRRTLLQAFTEHNERMEVMVGQHEYAAGTLERYRTAKDHISCFIRWKYQRDDIFLDQLNYEFVSDFAFWLRSVRKCEHNTTMKYVTNLKKIVGIAQRYGWLRSNPFANFKTTLRDVKKEPLSKLELESIKAIVFDIPRLAVIRDIFLFSCFTGLAYIDAKQLKQEHIVLMEDGEAWIDTCRQKTDTATRLPLLPEALQIVEKYRTDERCIGSGHVLPVPSNQKVNAYLKEIGDLAGIKKTLTFHIARHTFATTVTLANGVPMESVSKMLGHKSIKQTQHYAKIIDLKLKEDMNALKDRLNATG